MVKSTMYPDDLKSAVLMCIAADGDIDSASVSLGAKGAVFHRSGNELFCLCQQGSDYWNTIEAKVVAEQLIARAAYRHG